MLLDAFVVEKDVEQCALSFAVLDGELADCHGRVQDPADRDIAVVPEVDEDARAWLKAEQWRRPACAAVGVDVPPLARILPSGDVVVEQDVIVGAVPVSRRSLGLGCSCRFRAFPSCCAADGAGNLASWAGNYRIW